MFNKINLAIGILALLLFVQAQRQAWNLFDNEANPRGSGSTGSSRIYHK